MCHGQGRMLQIFLLGDIKPLKLYWKNLTLYIYILLLFPENFDFAVHLGSSVILYW